MQEFKTTEEQRQYARNRYKTNWRTRMSYLLNGARRRHGDTVTITLDEIMRQLENQNHLCYYSGIPLNLDTEKTMTTSMDRLDNSKSYEYGNVVLCLWCINRAKSSLSEETFISICKSVADWQRKKEN